MPSTASNTASDTAAMATKKPRGNGRKPLKQKNDIVPQEDSSLLVSKGKKKESTECDFENALKEMQEKMENLRIEKEKAEEMLKVKEEELENKGREHEKLQQEIKKLQKLKDFKPTVNLSLGSLIGEEGGKKKKGGLEHKRPLSPYILWCKDQWTEVKKDKPNAEFEEISNILGAKWKTISSEEKKPYEDKYKIEKEAYTKIAKQEKRQNEAMRLLDEEQKQKTAMELLEQYLQFKQEAEKESKKSKKEKDPRKPKQPLSAFLLYSNERRTALLAEGKNVVEAARTAGEEWKNMDESQRAPFEKVAKNKRDMYLQEIEAYKQMKEEEAMNKLKEEDELMKLHKQEAMKLLKKKEKTENMIKKTKEQRQKKKQQQDVDANKPKKPASSFILFSKETRQNLKQERPEITNSTLNSLISIKWKELGEEDRKVWNQKAAIAMETYKNQIAEYNKALPQIEDPATQEKSK